MEYGPAYYDKLYRDGFSTERFAPIYRWIANRAKEPVLDLGCGAGDMSCALYDRGIRKYVGIDFSEEAIRKARRLARFTPHRFVPADIRSIQLEDYQPFRTIVVAEVLEHIAPDKELVTKIPMGIRILGSLPTFSDTSHIRCFPTKESVSDRYEHDLSFKEIESIGQFDQWWVFDAYRTN